MEKRTPAVETPAVTRMHWTAPVSCGLSMCMVPLSPLLQMLAVDVTPVTPLHQVRLPLVSGLQRVPAWLPLLLTVLAFLVGGIAWAISSRPSWRKGRWLAIIGVVLPGIILALSGALLVYIAFFWHPPRLIFPW